TYEFSLVESEVRNQPGSDWAVAELSHPALTAIAPPESELNVTDEGMRDSDQPETSDVAIELTEFDFNPINLEAASVELVETSGEPVNSYDETSMTNGSWLTAEEKSIAPLAHEKGIQAADETPSLMALIENLKSNQPAMHAAVLQELAQMDEDEAFRIVTELFDDPASHVRNRAARVLHDFKPDRAASFTRALREGTHERRRHIAAAINGSGLANEAIQHLVGGSREQTYDAFSLLFLMARAGEVEPLLQTIEKYPDVAVRLSVIRLLTFSNQPEVIPSFRSLAVRAALPTEVRSALMEAIHQITNNVRQNSLSAA
ncbi:MAG: hypothetical protein QOJ88_1, partial [Pyrinomonadaceae bacterium]|nr:hypothetical protein [Pyrinomonadaceae bacterium]